MPRGIPSKKAAKAITEPQAPSLQSDDLSPESPTEAAPAMRKLVHSCVTSRNSDESWTVTYRLDGEPQVARNFETEPEALAFANGL